MTLKYTILYIHLIAMAVAVGKILEFDIRFLLQARAPMTPHGIASLKLTKSAVSAALAVLWFTGALLIGLGSLESPNYLDNEKLWVKVVIVSILTINGWVMHRWAFPALQGKTAFLNLPTWQMLGLASLATVSSVSWLYSSFLGIARPWNHSVPYSYPAAVYASLLVAAWIGASVLLLCIRRYSALSTNRRRRNPCPQG